MAVDIWDEVWVHDPFATRPDCACEARRGQRQIIAIEVREHERRVAYWDVWQHGKAIFELAGDYPEWRVVRDWMECHSGPRVTQVPSAWPLWAMQAQRYRQWQMPGSYGTGGR